MDANRLIIEAAVFARESHEGQTRKYTGDPYIVHPRAVAIAAAEYEWMPDSGVAAAYLHDVVEDCDVSIRQIGQKFGAEVEFYVWALTDPTDRSKNRAQRKFDTRVRYAGLTGGFNRKVVHTLKALDCADNAVSIRTHDPNFWKVFRREVIFLMEVLDSADERALANLKHEIFNVRQAEPVGA